MDECLAEPYFGSYIPSYIPEGMSFEYGYTQYRVEPKTGDLLRTEELTLTYSGERDPDTGIAEANYTITIAAAEDYGDIGWAGTLLTPNELTPETVTQFVDTTWGNGKPKERSDTTFGVQYGDVMVILYADNLEAEESYQIMSSISN